MNDRRAIRTVVLMAPSIAIALNACRPPHDRVEDRGPQRGSRAGVQERVRAERSGEVAAAATSASSPAADAGGSVPPHGDHNPHHGGLVLMNGDLHFEVVLDPDGRSHRVFFSDAVREDLPASIATGVTLTMRRPGGSEEQIALQIDSSGESWAGSGRAVADPAKTTVRVAFAIKGDAYWIDVPFEARK